MSLTSDMSLTTSENGAVTLSKKRCTVCYEAAAELYEVALMINDTVRISGDFDDFDVEDALASQRRVRCMAARVIALSNALMAGLGDDSTSVNGNQGLNSMVYLRDDDSEKSTA